MDQAEGHRGGRGGAAASIVLIVVAIALVGELVIVAGTGGATG